MGRGGFDGGPPRGGYGGFGGMGGGMGGGMPTSQIYVSNVCAPTRSCQFVVSLTTVLASIHCWLAGPQGPVPPSRLVHPQY